MSFTNKRLLYIILLFTCCGCKKIVTIPTATGFVTTDQVFSNDNEAISAATGMYYYLANAYFSFSNSAITICAGMSADELNAFDLTNEDYAQFQHNILSSTNGTLNASLWTSPYTVIYNANAIIDGLQGYAGVHDSIKNELIGEAEFVRAFCNFYLVNLFGDLPLVTTVNYHKTSILARTPQSQVYTQIINDLKDAQKRLPPDYSAGKGVRIVPNKWAATALLARCYLYIGDWVDAQIQSSSVINSSNLFTLVPDMDDIFLVNSNEAIWQLATDRSQYNFTWEGNNFIPYPSATTSVPPFYLTDSLLHSFESGDKRRSSWVGATNFMSKTYYYPYKYKIGSDNTVVNGPENNTVLRLAEQYLICAEAMARQGNLDSALLNLDTVRRRAGLPNSTAANQSDIIAAIFHETKIEFFAEWGHRWLDLKRTDQAADVLSINKGFPINKKSLVYPLPLSDLQTDPNLTQNDGY